MPVQPLRVEFHYSGSFPLHCLLGPRMDTHLSLSGGEQAGSGESPVPLIHLRGFSKTTPSTAGVQLVLEGLP